MNTSVIPIIETGMDGHGKHMRLEDCGTKANDDIRVWPPEEVLEFPKEGDQS